MMDWFPRYNPHAEAARESELRRWAFSIPPSTEGRDHPMYLSPPDPIQEAYDRMERDGDSNEDYHDRYTKLPEWG